MVRYPIRLTADDNGTFLVDFPDVPEAHTFGDTKEEATERATDALLTALDIYIKDRRPIPAPSRRGQEWVEVPPLDEAKLELYKAMQQKNVTQYALAKRLDWHVPQLKRVLQLRYQSKFSQLERALAAVGKRVVLDVEDRPSRRPAGGGRAAR